MMKLTCVIVDDEPLAREGLAKYVEAIDYLTLVGSAENPLELDKLLENENVDLIFLDIQMPFMSGLDFLKIKKDLPMVIITTAYQNYALEGFQFDVMDYLLKPITFNRFFKAVSKAREYQQYRNHKAGVIEEIDRNDFFFIKCDNKFEKIFINEILFIQALENYVFIQTETNKYMTLISLKAVEEYLDNKHFIQVHKSYIIAVSKIKTIENNEIFIQGFKIPLSRSFKEQVLDKVLKDNLLRK
ncbi:MULTISPECIES: LytTR family DNA-binding domain-containing protein [unclassified Arcicella]|uniref:LytR/AlgR family response regulator transcription factor n=1 Tax=unclassified Arcicella TaxID=2644986 RepID=UPI00285EBA09|nr:MULTISPECIES: LytTR family DNA-binding domain-containing protein [unclassified Arcicella]MDR6562777.1 DNA-binding LytR/AlgR family response regulator [Arcicella sp. BE51]MDR6812879.1 DNA-binding LytR/AlgR family response regulator [Arcicella sp. BE140]MDR6824193.1 DNA-binding LytR/AlgR family response regulator [Arcicella sp. BE139]